LAGSTKEYARPGCPKCGERELIVPDFITRETQINCPRCGSIGTWGDVFDPENEGPGPLPKPLPTFIK
jgi:DNA-directed RNA polymerase subunit RPC12/RpoP